MHRSAALLLSSLFIGTIAACGGSTAANGNAEEASAPVVELQGEFPQDVVVGPGSGPALFLNAASPAIGYLSPGVSVRVTGPPENGRVPVRIMGGLKIRGHMDAGRVGGYIQTRGRVRGAPCYVGPNDLVGLREVDAEGLRHIVLAPPIGYGVTLGPFDAVYPDSRISQSEAPEDAEPPTEGELRGLPAGQDVPIYDQPGQNVVATIPAHNPPFVVTLVRDRGEWKGVRVGQGPYVIGYVNVELAPVAGHITVAAEASEDAIPTRLREEATRPLFRVSEGARVKFEGRTFAIFEGSGYAREMNRFDDENMVDVFAAVDDDIAIRGMIDARHLEPVEPVAPPPVPVMQEEDAFDSDFE